MVKIKARQYAEALYNLAKEENVVEDYVALSLALLNVANENPAVFEYFASNNIENDEKQNFIKELTQGYLYYENWLNILLDSGRAMYVRDYINEFLNIYNKEKGIIKGHVYTVEPLSSEIIQTLEENVSKKINKKVMLENKINKELIGGIKLEVEDEVWDNTIKNKLKQLLKEGVKT